MTPRITSVDFAPARAIDVQQGLLGWATAIIDDALALHSLAIRRTRQGRYAVSFPMPTDGKGRRRVIVHPVNVEIRASIEIQVIEKLREQGVLDP